MREVAQQANPANRTLEVTVGLDRRGDAWHAKVGRRIKW
jgi:hypothetical protein